MIYVNHLTKKYARTTAVRDVSFEVPEGQVVGLLGPNGAGKSTILRILTGFLFPTQGSVSIRSQGKIFDPLQARQWIGYLPENNPLYEDLRVTEYLYYRAQLLGLSRHECRDHVRRVMRRCWIEDVQRSIIVSLSKGYRQRVGLAAALLGQPKILILDEPTVGLDPHQVIEARKLIKTLSQEHTILLSSHILSEVEMLIDVAIILKEGRIVAHGETAELRRKHCPCQELSVDIMGKDSSSIEQDLLALPQVSRVVHRGSSGGYEQFHIQSPLAEDLRTEIFQLCVKNQWTLRELHQKAISLEDVFISVTSSNTPAEGMVCDV